MVSSSDPFTQEKDSPEPGATARRIADVAVADVADHESSRAKWESLGFAAMMLVVVMAALLGLWLTSKKSAYTGYGNHLVNLARAAASSVDPKLHNSIRRPEQLNDADYRRAVEPLRRMRRAIPDIHYIYTLVRSGSKAYFVLDAADPAARGPNGLLDQSGVWQPYPYFSAALRRALGNDSHPGIPTYSDEPFTDEWGTFMTGFVPLLDGAGQQIGVLGVDVDASRFLERQRQSRNRAFLGLIPAGLLTGIFARIYYRVRRRGLADGRGALEAAQQDRLTALPNRTVFMEHLEAALTRIRNQQQSRCAVLFFDFDRFKVVNDTLGHRAGDELLRQIGRRLQSALRSDAAGAAGRRGDLISRFGGDEFLVLVNNLHSSEDAVRVAERLLNSLAPRYDILGHEVHSMASVGIAVSEQFTGNAEEIIRNADVAMYEAKRAGRGCSVVFSEAMHARLTRHVAIETSLRRAISEKELHVRYEPVVDLETGARRGVQAVVGWDHPALGPICAKEFMPIAEESGLLAAIGEWLLERVCHDMVKWRSTSSRDAPEHVNINLWRPQLARGERLVAQLRAILESSGLPPSCLQLEISECELQHNSDAATRICGEIGNLGVKTALGGFGAGHCSLTVLRAYPWSTVKIDPSCLQDLQGSHADLAVISATLTLVSNLGLCSVAEGVKSSAEVAILQSLGCHCAQGSVFGSSMTAAEVIATPSLLALLSDLGTDVRDVPLRSV